MSMNPSAPPFANTPSSSMTSVFGLPGPSMAQPLPSAAAMTAAPCSSSPRAMRDMPSAIPAIVVACTGAPHPSTPLTVMTSPVRSSIAAFADACTGCAGSR